MVGEVIEIDCGGWLVLKFNAFDSNLLKFATFLSYLSRLELVNAALLFGFVLLEKNNLFKTHQNGHLVVEQRLHP